MKKVIFKLTVIILPALILLYSFITLAAQIAYAEDYDALMPAFGLYCYDKQVNMSGSVKIDMTSEENFNKGLAYTQSEYSVSAGGQEIEFALPFLCRVMDMKDINVYVDNQLVRGQIYYGGDRAFFYENIEIEDAISDAFSGDFDETIMGTLYEVIPDSETITVSLYLSKGQSMIYETSNHLSSSHSAQHIEFTMHNAQSKSKYQFFIIGELSQEEFTASCEVQKQEMTCKAYIDSVYEEIKEYYIACGNPPVEFLYSQVNALIKENRYTEFTNLFFKSISQYRVNLFRFRANISEMTKISFSYALDIQYDSHYNPIIYRIKQIHSGAYPIKFEVKLNASNPYVLLNSGAIQPDNGEYSVECIDEDFSITFSSSASPVNWLQQQREKEAKYERTRLIILVVCGIVGSAGIIALIVLICWRFCPRFTKR